MFDYRQRLTDLQELMASSDVDVALLSVGADLPYFTGYEAMPSERLTVLVVPAQSEPVLLIPELEAPRVDSEMVEIRAWSEAEDPVELAAGLTDPEVAAVGDHMWSVFLTRFQSAWDARWLPASELTSVLRVRKDPREVALLRDAARGIDRVMKRIPSEVAFLGRTEIEIARQLRELTVDEGHDTAEFAIVASGPNGASPHHHPASREVALGDLIVCDFGGRKGGYFSDSTRTFVVGEPTARQSEAHAVVAAANVAGRQAVAPGVTCGEVDRAVREVVADAGFGEFFIHRTGHGIGLEVHEEPYLVAGNETELEPGMTFSIEPGIYLPEKFGIRIEDIVVCTDKASETLNQSDRGLVPVG